MDAGLSWLLRAEFQADWRSVGWTRILTLECGTRQKIEHCFTSMNLRTHLRLVPRHERNQQLVLVALVQRSLIGSNRYVT
jgi:hypothetical protein